MKRFVLIVTALILAFSLCACTNNSNEIVQDDGTKLAGRQAGNEAVQYSFIYPEDWSLIRNDGVIEIQKDCNPSEVIAEYATLTTLAFTLSDSEQLAKDYWEEHKAEVQKAFSDFQERDSQEITLGDTVALKVKYSCTMNDRTYISEQIICCRAGDVFFVTLVVPEDYYDEASSVITTVTEKFTFA